MKLQHVRSLGVKNMKLLFWNINSKAEAISSVDEIVRNYSIDLVILAEAKEHISRVCIRLGSQFHRIDNVNPKTRVDLFYNKSNISSASMRLSSKDGYVAIYSIIPKNYHEINICALHLRSPLTADIVNRNALAMRCREYIEDAEEDSNHSRTVVVGDFNLDPFDSALVSSEGFHAVMTKNIARQKKRIISAVKRLYFYNPMWKFYGDYDNRPSGTYFYKKADPVCHFWHIFDQVLIRPSLVECFVDVYILASDGNRDLINYQNIPRVEISDHLPIYMELNFNETH